MNFEYRGKLLELKRVMKQFISKGYFELFHSENLFYLLDFKSKAVLFFSERFFNNSFGIQIFFDDSGLNYLHDAFTSEDGFSVNPFFSNAILLSVVPKGDLIEDDKQYLHQNKLRVTEQNFIPYRFKEGYGLDYLSLKELDKVLDYLYYLSSLLSNEKEDVIKAFEEQKMVFSFFNPEELVYEVRYSGMVNLESFPAKHAKNQDFIADNQLLNYTEDHCYLLHAYLPINKKSKDPYPSILMLYSEQKKSYRHQLIFCKPNRICDYIYAFLDDYFKENGIPTVITINDRKIYRWVQQTLQALNMEVYFKRENQEPDELVYELFEKILEEPHSENVNSFHYIS